MKNKQGDYSKITNIELAEQIFKQKLIDRIEKEDLKSFIKIDEEDPDMIYLDVRIQDAITQRGCREHKEFKQIAENGYK